MAVFQNFSDNIILNLIPLGDTVIQKAQFPLVFPKPTPQCTFIFNKLEKHHGALYIIQSMISAVVAVPIDHTGLETLFSLTSRVHAVLLQKGFSLSKGFIGFSHLKKPIRY